MKRVTEIVFSIQNADEEKRLVSGVSDSGEPNGSGLLLDYATSKPLLVAWSENIEKKTKGRSKGILRVMHQLENVGHIVSLEFDDDAKKILVTVYVSDDKTWEKVKSGEYTGFSWWWRTQGMPWKDAEATKKYGKPIHSYTGKPIELSIVDSACVPGSDFTLIQNAEFQDEGDEMADEIEDKAGDSTEGKDVKNGVYTAGRLMSLVEDLSYLQKAVAAEEGKEGDSADIPAELLEAVQMFAPIAAKYATAQLAELVKGEDVDMFVPDDDEFEDIENADDGAIDDVMNGDYPGHPFRGNQHTGGKGGKAKAHHKASLAAHRASVGASRGKVSHAAAAKAHRSAAAMHGAKGNKAMESHHKQQAKFHANESKLRAQAKAFQNADKGQEGDVQNADKPETSADILASLASAAAPAAADVKNADAEDKTTLVTKDDENGVNVKNAETIKAEGVRAEAERIAALPEPARAAAVAAALFRGVSG